MSLAQSTLPLVSIIVNNYNYADFLEDAIKSALNQSYYNTEVIVVDDGSNDSSILVIRKYLDAIVYIQKENGGQASAINYGFSVCRGDFILILDSDDILLPNAIELCIKAIANVTCPISRVYAPLRIRSFDESTHNKILPYQSLYNGSLRDFSLRNGPASYPCPPMSGNLWSKDFLSQVLPIPEPSYRTSADAYLFTLSPLFGEFISVQEPIGTYRLHSENNYWNKGINCKKLKHEIYQYKKRCLAMERFAKFQGEIVDGKSWRIRHRYYLAKIVSIWKLTSSLPVPVSFKRFTYSVFSSDINIYRKLMWIVWFLCMILVPKRFSAKLVEAYLGLQFRVEKNNVY
jgi:glycosyltransferase involved in cell wall biosynthesis